MAIGDKDKRKMKDQDGKQFMWYGWFVCVVFFPSIHCLVFTEWEIHSSNPKIHAKRWSTCMQSFSKTEQKKIGLPLCYFGNTVRMSVRARSPATKAHWYYTPSIYLSIVFFCFTFLFLSSHIFFSEWFIQSKALIYTVYFCASISVCLY